MTVFDHVGCLRDACCVRAEMELKTPQPLDIAAGQFDLASCAAGVATPVSCEVHCGCCDCEPWDARVCSRATDRYLARCKVQATVWCSLMPFAVWWTLRFPCHAIPTSSQCRNGPLSHVIKFHFMVFHGQSCTLLGMHGEIVLNDTLWEQILCVHAQFTKAKHGKTTVHGF
jgi:hypothetical protein